MNTNFVADQKPYALHWFRRDLRLEGYPALDDLIEEYEGRVLFFFNFDRKFLSRPDFSHGRFYFFLKTLEKLKQKIETQGGTFLFFDQAPEKTIVDLIQDCTKYFGRPPTKIHAARDYEPFARNRDERVQNLVFDQFKIPVVFMRDHLLIEPEELTKPSGEGWYQVYTPFSKRWLELFQSQEINQRLRRLNQSLKSQLFTISIKAPPQWILKSDALFLEILEETSKKCPFQLPETGFDAAKSKLKYFSQNAFSKYSENRDFPNIQGTSGMSVYFKNGSFTTSHAICFLKLTPQDEVGIKYFKELIWREFYYHILFHRPDVENSSFQKHYDQLKWQNNHEWFEKWKSGQTGYPIVDAGMRQLNTTGWMHNRVRMIVASFLTKDLLIDWRWGEKYFMEMLLDGDLAPNNGGWQWAASTGCDAQPYFRIFNPTSQSEKFDPSGDYIRKYVRERSKESVKTIHEPLAPIVDHGMQREKALSMFKDVRAQIA